MPKTWRALAAVGLFGIACGVERLDAGSIDDHAPASTDAGAAAREKKLWPFGQPSNSFNLPCTRPAPPQLAGTWSGQFDSFELASGSSAIRVDVTGAYEDADGLCGTVTFGQGAAPPIATDPGAPPPGEPENPTAPPPGATDFRSGWFLEGFPYEFYEPGRQHFLRTVIDAGTAEVDDGGFSVIPGAVDGDHAKFHITGRQPIKSWCNLQFSYLITDNKPSQNILLGPTASCVPPSALDDKSGSNNDYCGPLTGIPIHGVSCTQALYCTFHYCDCGSDNVGNESPPHGCTVRMTNDFPFDLNLDGSAMAGTLTANGATVLPLHLTRVP